MRLSERIGRSQRVRAPRQHRTDYLAFNGGLNTEDSKFSIAPGECVAAENYEPGTEGGYEVFGGMERFDGRPSPSRVFTYNYLPYRAFSSPLGAQMASGQVIEGVTSGATGRVIQNVETYPSRSQIYPHSEDLKRPGLYASANYPKVGEVAWDWPLLRLKRLETFAYTGAAVNTVIGSVNTLTDPITQVGGGNVLVPGERWRLSCYVQLDPARTPRTGVRLAFTDYGDPEALVGVCLHWSDAGNVGVIAVTEAGMDVRGGAGGFESTLAGVDYFGAELVDEVAGVYRVWVQGVASFFTDAVEITQNLVNNQDAGKLDTVAAPWVDDQAAGYSDTVSVSLTGMQFERTGSHLVPGSPVYRDPLTAGTYGFSDTDPPALAETGHGYVLLEDYSGDFIQDEDLRLLGTTQILASAWEASQANGIPYDGRSLEDVVNAQRSAVQPVPGVGPVRGVCGYAGKVFAWRDKATGGAGMYEATGAGWTEIEAAGHVYFENGTQEFAVGESVVGELSGLISTVHAVYLQGGSYSAGDARGVLIVTNGSDSYGYSFGEELRQGGVAFATCVTGDQPTFASGGRYEFRAHNFYGAGQAQRVYGVNGVNRAFEYDDSTGLLAFIDTGMDTDTPEHIGVPEDHLLLTFGASVQFSAPGAPFVWRPLLGAGEISLGTDCVGVLEEVNNATFLFGKDRVRVLTGRSIDSFQLSDYAIEVDCYPGTIQRIGNGIFLGGFGFSTLSASDTFGQFSYSTISRNIQREIPEIVADARASVVFGRESRYRCFLENGFFWSFAFTSGGQLTGIMPCRLPVNVYSACNSVGDDGTERVFVGSDGYVYELDIGGSMDGNPLYAFFTLPYNIQGRPGMVKHFGRAELDALVFDEVDLTVSVVAPLGDQSVEVEHDVSASRPGGFWDQMEWDNFWWDEPPSTFRPFKMDIQGDSLSLTFRHVGNGQKSHTLRGISFDTAFRRLARSTYG